ncbi:hypothetical protein GCM10009785_28830 [Brooklawnia cerclae]|uniref:Membrane associated rhomboid family serine protease n=1 Tax=Brooklawnia cerclae TaxID=349934 RepID=A0ABX0SJB9_9ACTN|nr:rhomboid family intramembrane serine protease [Brooklawnia cerclae]NIH56826.1 membrane associated rhomboid family serine protease [Brooklawnia cerclae]
MDENGTDDYSRWPDFIPPEFEQSPDEAPGKPDEPVRPVVPPGGTASQQPPATAAPGPSSRPWQPDAGQSFRRSPGSAPWPPSAGGYQPPRVIPPSHPSMHGRMVFRRAGDKPSVTSVIIGICVVVWMLQNVSYQVNDMVTLIPALGAQEPWRFLTSAFAHAPRSLTHIGFNMLALWLLGRMLEPLLGHAKFLAIYLISALGSGALFVLLAFPPSQGAGGYGTNWYSGVVGASGAVFGLFGALLVITLIQKGDVKPILILLGLNAAMAVLVPGIAWQGHLGGFLAGLAATGVLALDARRAAMRKPSLVWPGLAIVAVVIVLAVVAKYSLV